jgi:transcriptional regulator with XRE-family HTH domain
MNVVENIKEIRIKKGLTQQAIADALNADFSAISRLESGKRDLKFDELAIIANVFKMNVIDIITYPDVYVKKSAAYKTKSTRVSLQIDIDQEDIKADVIKLVLGDRILEIKNK